MPSEAKACLKISTLVGIFFSERETPRALARGWCRDYFYPHPILSYFKVTKIGRFIKGGTLPLSIMALFGITPEEAQRIARETARTAVDTAVGALRCEYDSRLQAAEAEATKLGGQLSDATRQLSQLEKTVAEQTGTLKDSSAKLSELTGRLAEYEASQQHSSIVAPLTLPPSDITFAAVLETARHVADEAYQRIRDYFLVQMAQKGYEQEMPDFTIFDKDSGITLSFYQSRDDGRHLNEEGRKSKTGVWLTNFPAKFDLIEQQGQQRLYGSNNRMSNCDFALSVSGSEGWSAQLREDLPNMLKAYMFGHALVRLNTNDHKTAVDLMHKYGLEQQTPLLQRIRELMSHDATLAEKIRSTYSVETR